MTRQEDLEKTYSLYSASSLLNDLADTRKYISPYAALPPPPPLPNIPEGVIESKSGPELPIINEQLSTKDTQVSGDTDDDETQYIDSILELANGGSPVENDDDDATISDPDMVDEETFLADVPINPDSELDSIVREVIADLIRQRAANQLPPLTVEAIRACTLIAEGCVPVNTVVSASHGQITSQIYAFITKRFRSTDPRTSSTSNFPEPGPSHLVGPRPIPTFGNPRPHLRNPLPEQRLDQSSSSSLQHGQGDWQRRTELPSRPSIGQPPLRFFECTRPPNPSPRQASDLSTLPGPTQIRVPLSMPNSPPVSAPFRLPTPDGLHNSVNKHDVPGTNGHHPLPSNEQGQSVDNRADSVPLQHPDLPPPTGQHPRHVPPQLSPPPAWAPAPLASIKGKEPAGKKRKSAGEPK